MYKSKSLQDLKLINSFLFSESTENPQDAECMAKHIIERATGKKIKEISVLPEKLKKSYRSTYPFGYLWKNPLGRIVFCIL